jgi:hypothetical protein
MIIVRKEPAKERNVELLTRETIRTLIAPQEPPCVSIYQPTHRHHPDNVQDPIRFKNLLRQVEESLGQKYRGREVRPILEPLQQLADNSLFWNHTLDGLAVLATTQSFRVFQLQIPVPELAVVADSFHVKPLIRKLQTADRYQVLGLTRQTAKLYEGNRYTLDPLDVNADFPATLTDALGDQLTQPQVSVRTVGTATVQHGQGSRSDEIDKDTERYFRAVDRAVLERYSKPSGLPLILAALPENQSAFRALSQNHLLLPQGVTANPDSMTTDQLRDAVWAVVEPTYLERLAKLSEEFGASQAHRAGTADLSDAARAAIAGRVAKLLVEADRVTPGKLDPDTGAITPGDLNDPDTDDLIDDLAEVVLRNGGEVIVVPADKMPPTAKQGIAAFYRY